MLSCLMTHFYCPTNLQHTGLLSDLIYFFRGFFHFKIVVNFPAFLGTVRRFLEQYGDTIEHVVFVLDTNSLGMYKLLAPLYFPRNAIEAVSCRHQLPNDIGHPTSGEPIINDRRIRIIDNPQHSFEGKPIGYI